MTTVIENAKRLIADVSSKVLSGKSASSSPRDRALQSAYESVLLIRALMTERGQLEGLREGESEKADSLNTQLKDLDSARVEALTDHRVSGGGGASEKAQALLAQSNAVRQELNDIQAVVNGIDRRIADLENQMEPLKRRYQVDMGAFLGDIYHQLAAHYQELAPEVGETLLQIAAVRRVMLRYLAGNTNGWDGRALLPGIQPGEGRYIKPLLDADSSQFANGANERMEEIFKQMRSAGFIWRFD